ncbi:MAG: hypothetical protein GX638_12170 [Crenarchaeota archaeon]|nr:hypothetical protein [Thermoproteota archaeon]
MTEQKTKIVSAIILAILLPFLLFGISYALFDQTSQQSNTTRGIPEPLLSQIVWVIQWISIVVLLSITIMGIIIFVSRKISKKTPMATENTL